MTPKISQQKQIMELCLKQLNEIETIKRLIQPFDPLTAKVMIAEHQALYAKFSSLLFENFLKIKS